MTVLTGPRRDAASGEASALVILLHGFGADGNDLIGLADPLAPHLPKVTFVAPNAPQKCSGNPMGYQWFPIPWMDGSSEAEMKQGFESSSAILNGYLDEMAKEFSADRTILVGFSQGTMMSLHVGPQRADQLAGIIGFSGRLMQPELLADAKSKPPIQLIHGDSDQVVPPNSMPEAESALKSRGFDVKTHLSRGVAHGIAPDGLQLALKRIQGWIS